jgi:hypothetical protein
MYLSDLKYTCANYFMGCPDYVYELHESAGNGMLNLVVVPSVKRKSEMFAPVELLGMCIGLNVPSSRRLHSDLGYILNPVNVSVEVGTALYNASNAHIIYLTHKPPLKKKQVIGDILNRSTFFKEVVGDSYSKYFRKIVSDIITLPQSVFDSLFYPKLIDCMSTDLLAIVDIDECILVKNRGLVTNVDRRGNVVIISPLKIGDEEYKDVNPMDLSDFVTARISNDPSIISPNASIIYSVGYSFKEVSLDEYINWDFPNPLKFGSDKEAPVKIDDVIIPFCVMELRASSNLNDIHDKLRFIDQPYHFIISQEDYDLHLPTFDTILTRSDLYPTLTKKPRIVKIDEMYSSHPRYVI